MEFFGSHRFSLELSHLPVIKTAFEDTLNQLIRLHMTGDSTAITSVLGSLTVETLKKIKLECDTVSLHNPHLVKEYHVIQNAIIEFVEQHFPQ